MKTFKILIADDEYWTREKLRRMIDWECYGLTMLEPARDGEEALLKIEENCPDILITDINMPFVSGVDLLREIQKKYPNVICFVLSGYNDFEYVKEAFLAGSVNYLVKPVSRIDLVNAIVKALDILERRNQDRQEANYRREEYLKAASLLQDREFSQLLEQKNASLMPDISMNSGADFAGAKLVLIKIHNMSGFSLHYQYDMNLLSFRVKQKIKTLLGDKNAMIFNHIYRSNEFILLMEEDVDVLVQMAKKLLEEFGHSSDSPVTVVINESSCTLDTIYQSYVQAVALLMTRSYTPESVLLRSSESLAKDYGKEQAISHISEEQINQLHALWRTGKKEEIRRMMFETIGIQNCGKQKWRYLEVRQTVRRMINTWEEFMYRSREDIQNVDCAGMAEAADKEVEKLDVRYLLEILEEMIELAYDAIQENQAEKTSSLVRQAAAYIDECYFEPLTLSALAERYHVESSYFSRIFRREMGENLIRYLSRTRIEKAKMYMQKTNVNLTEIAFMVGYDDYTYFNKVFRKMTGISPREYKQSLEGTACEEGGGRGGRE